MAFIAYGQEEGYRTKNRLLSRLSRNRTDGDCKRWAWGVSFLWVWSVL